MKKQLLTLIALCSLCFVSCDSTHTNLVEDDNISLEVTLERNTSSPYPLDIIYKLTNLSDKTVYYDTHQVPYNGAAKYLFTVQEDGTPVKYQGPNVYYISYQFDTLAPGETFSTFVSLDKRFRVTKGTHNYTISYKGGISAKTSDSKTELIDDPKDTGTPIQPDELAPKDHTSKIVPVKSNILEFEATINQIRELE